VGIEVHGSLSYLQSMVDLIRAIAGDQLGQVEAGLKNVEKAIQLYRTEAAKEKQQA
jgi:hypothetical protein